jgi:hypothetical protein
VMPAPYLMSAFKKSLRNDDEISVRNAKVLESEIFNRMAPKEN